MSPGGRFAASCCAIALVLTPACSRDDDLLSTEPSPTIGAIGNETPPSVAPPNTNPLLVPTTANLAPTTTTTTSTTTLPATTSTTLPTTTTTSSTTTSTTSTTTTSTTTSSTTAAPTTAAPTTAAPTTAAPTTAPPTSAAPTTAPPTTAAPTTAPPTTAAPTTAPPTTVAPTTTLPTTPLAAAALELANTGALCWGTATVYTPGSAVLVGANDDAIALFECAPGAVEPRYAVTYWDGVDLTLLRWPNYNEITGYIDLSYVLSGRLLATGPTIAIQHIEREEADCGTLYLFERVLGNDIELLGQRTRSCTDPIVGDPTDLTNWPVTYPVP